MKGLYRAPCRGYIGHINELIVLLLLPPEPDLVSILGGGEEEEEEEEEFLYFLSWKALASPKTFPNHPACL